MDKETKEVREGTVDQGTLERNAEGVLFDVDALRREIADLAKQGVEVRELPQSTLPPMRIDLQGPTNGLPPEQPALQVEGRAQSAPGNILDPMGNPVVRSTTLPPVTTPKDETKSPSRSQDDFHRPPLKSTATAPPPVEYSHNAWADEFEDDFGQEREVKMTFE